MELNPKALLRHNNKLPLPENIFLKTKTSLWTLISLTSTATLFKSFPKLPNIIRYNMLGIQRKIIYIDGYEIDDFKGSKQEIRRSLFNMVTVIVPRISEDRNSLERSQGFWEKTNQCL